MTTNRLRALRKLKRLTQSELGEMFGFNEQHIRRWELGTRKLDYKTACKLAEFFGVSVDYLLDEESNG